MRVASEMEDALAGLLVSEGSSTLAARPIFKLSVEAAVLAEASSSRSVESVSVYEMRKKARSW